MTLALPVNFIAALGLRARGASASALSFGHILL